MLVERSRETQLDCSIVDEVDVGVGVEVEGGAFGGCLCVGAGDAWEECGVVVEIEIAVGVEVADENRT